MKDKPKSNLKIVHNKSKKEKGLIEILGDLDESLHEVLAKIEDNLYNDPTDESE